jgi:3-hydroxybutyrate dehydrogenase
MGCVIAINCRRRSRHSRRGARHEEARLGPHHHTASAHSLVASPFKSAYVSAKRHRRLTKTVALELATFKITCNCISPGYVWTPLVENQIPETMQARGMTEDQVINDVLLAAQPTKEFRPSNRNAAQLFL